MFGQCHIDPCQRYAFLQHRGKAGAGYNPDPGTPVIQGIAMGQRFIRTAFQTHQNPGRVLLSAEQSLTPHIILGFGGRDCKPYAGFKGVCLRAEFIGRKGQSGFNPQPVQCFQPQRHQTMGLPGSPDCPPYSGCMFGMAPDFIPQFPGVPGAGYQNSGSCRKSGGRAGAS